MGPRKSRSYELDDLNKNSVPPQATAAAADGTLSSENGRVLDVELSESKTTMPRELGLTGAISLIVGGIIGSGIFVSPAGVLGATGSVGLSLVVWFGAGLIALMGALCYSELGTMIPRSGGDYSYIRKAFGDMPAFVYIWVSVILVRPSSLAVMSLTFGTYFAAVFDLCGTPVLVERLGATACLVTVMVLNCYSTRLANRVTIFSSAFKVIALLIIVGAGIYKLSQGSTSVLATGFQGSTKDVTVISLAFYDAFWAYDGWINLNSVTEEMKNPQRNLPLANITGVTVIIIVYLATNVAYLTAMTTDELLEADAVAVLFGDRVLKEISIFIPISVMVSTFGAVNATAFAGGRPVFAAARDGNLPSILSYIHVDKLTPLPSMVFTISLAIVFVFLGSISSLIDFFSFTAWFFYGMNFCALLYFRYKLPDEPRPYKCPIVIPIVMLIIAAYLVIAPIVNDPSIEFLYAAIFMCGGAILYIPTYFQWKVPFIDKLTGYSQAVMEVVPTTKFID